MRCLRLACYAKCAALAADVRPQSIIRVIRTRLVFCFYCAAFPESFPHQEEAGQEGQAKQAYSPLDPFQD